MTNDQRMRNLTDQIRQIETRRSRIEVRLLDISDGEARASLSDELAMLERELSEAQAELLSLTGGDLRQQAQSRAILLLNSRLATVEGRLDAMGEQVSALHTRLTTWFAQDAADRRRGYWLSGIFRVVSLALMAWAIRLLEALIP